MPLIEIVSSKSTSEKALQQATAFAQHIGKTAVAGEKLTGFPGEPHPDALPGGGIYTLRRRCRCRGD